MAINIPSGCYRQPYESVGRDNANADTFSYVLKGPYQALDELSKTIVTGTEVVEGWIASTWKLARNPGNTGTLTISCNADADGVQSVPSDVAEKALDETWTIKSVRNDVSILAYCGTGNDNPCREWIEAWQKEPDGSLAKNFAFTRANGTVFRFGGGEQTPENRATATRELIAKIQAGIDSVMRFYPMLIRTRTYSKPPAAVYENLSTIDTPTVGKAADYDVIGDNGQTVTVKASTNRLMKPGNLDSIISAHDWLKCQDDCIQTGDGKFQRIEAWMGVLNADGGWDENLYGNATQNRWPMPYGHSQDSKG